MVLRNKPDPAFESDARPDELHARRAHIDLVRQRLRKEARA